MRKDVVKITYYYDIIESKELCVAAYIYILVCICVCVLHLSYFECDVFISL